MTVFGFGWQVGCIIVNMSTAEKFVTNPSEVLLRVPLSARARDIAAFITPSGLIHTP